MNSKDYTRLALQRWQDCKVMSDAARFAGLDAKPELVNRHYARFCQWYEGRLATGYLIRVTGIQRINKGST